MSLERSQVMEELVSMQVFLHDLEYLLLSDQPYERVEKQLLGLTEKTMTLGINGDWELWIQLALAVVKEDREQRGI